MTKKQIWKPGNMIYPVPAVMVTVADRNGKVNIITVAWTGTICTNPPMAYISVRPDRYSYAMLEDTGEFVINLTTKDLVFATDFCGVKSGREVDKFQVLGLTRGEAVNVDVPIITESPVNIECRVLKKQELGSHTMFLAEVVTVQADEAYLDKNGRFDLALSEPIVYSHGEYFCLGEKLGKFGYSIQKHASFENDERIRSGRKSEELFQTEKGKQRKESEKREQQLKMKLFPEEQPVDKKKPADKKASAGKKQSVGKKQSAGKKQSVGKERLVNGNLKTFI